MASSKNTILSNYVLWHSTVLALLLILFCSPSNTRSEQASAWDVHLLRAKYSVCNYDCHEGRTCQIVRKDGRKDENIFQ